MTALTAWLNRFLVPALTALSENTYFSAIRAGMVAVVPLTIIGGLFLVVAFLPVSGWDQLVAPWLDLLQIPVTATSACCRSSCASPSGTSWRGSWARNPP